MKSFGIQNKLMNYIYLFFVFIIIFIITEKTQMIVLTQFILNAFLFSIFVFEANVISSIALKCC